MRSAAGITLLAACSFAATLNNDTHCAGVFAIRSTCRSAQAHHQRDVLYVGSSLLNIRTGNLTVNQLYVENLTPSSGVTEAKPLLFFHGGAISGTTWLNTPDSQTGFASYFLSQGYQVYLVDHASVGRSS